MPPPPQPVVRALPVLVAASVTWAVAFGVLHVVWSAGSRVAITDPVAADDAFGQHWFQAYNLTVAVACLVLTVATVGIRVAGERLRRVARSVVAAASVVLLLRGAVGVVQLVWLVATGQRSAPLTAWWVDGYMLAGGLLCAALVHWHPGRRSVPAPGAHEGHAQP